jgi:hypothetical protein
MKRSAYSADYCCYIIHLQQYGYDTTLCTHLTSDNKYNTNIPSSNTHVEFNTVI